MYDRYVFIVNACIKIFWKKNILFLIWLKKKEHHWKKTDWISVRNVMTKVSIFGESYLKNQDVMMSSVIANGHIGMPHVMHHHPYDLEDNFLQILGKNLFYYFSVQAFALLVIGNLLNIGHPLLFRLSNSEREEKKIILVKLSKSINCFSI